MKRTILHVDLDAFFASVEQRDDPSLRGKPVIVGGSRRRGVVAAASYEARTFGVFSAMSMAEALRRCPQAIVVRHHMDRYAEASRGFFQILDDFSPEVEGLSFDEAFLDLTGSERLLGPAREVGVKIKQRVRDELRLVASVGVAPHKFAAKLASDIDKPDGLRVVEEGRLLEFLHPMPVSRLFGVGEVTGEALRQMGVLTIGDVARYPVAALVGKLGATTGTMLAGLARGEDARPVESEQAPVSVGHQETFDHDLYEREDLEVVLLHQLDRVAERLRRAELRATVVAVIVKHDDFRQLTRRTTLADPTSDAAVLVRAAVRLLDQFDIDDRPKKRVRLLGAFAAGLEARSAPRQLALDEATRARGERLGDTLDKLKDKFGAAVVKRAVHLDEDDEEAGRSRDPGRGRPDGD
ncbi:MAG TPA: DNA polymerase IV [Kofleriaceae bacterium]|nr:DNA polymerase IV [Kofleriaceae bacterium]